MEDGEHAEGDRRDYGRVPERWNSRPTAAFIERMVPVSSPEAAELVKLLENTFRAVNIALVNEIAQIADRLGVNVWEVVDAAATKAPSGS